MATASVGQPDLYERLTARAQRWRDAHPLLVTRARRMWCVGSWAALVVGLLTLLFVPSTRRGFVVVLTVQYVLLQLCCCPGPRPSRGAATPAY